MGKITLTSKLKPATVAKELPSEAAERGNSPRWPTNIREIMVMQNCNTVTDISGPANHSCFFASSNILLFCEPVSVHLSLLNTIPSLELWSSGEEWEHSMFSLSISFFASVLQSWYKSQEVKGKKLKSYLFSFFCFFPCKSTQNVLNFSLSNCICMKHVQGLSVWTNLVTKFNV